MLYYTLTLNPSLDYVVKLPQFKTGAVNRTVKESIYPGGKGINVSTVLHNLGHESVAMGFTAGFTGYEIEKLLKEIGCQTSFVHLASGYSRINVKLISGEETDINAVGPQVGTDDIEALFRELNNLPESSTLVLSGSIPQGVPNDIYAQIMRHLSGKKIRFVVDAERSLLESVLPQHPFLIKPNHFELGDYFGTAIKSADEAVDYALKLREMGAQNVLVSMAEKGAVLADEMNGLWRIEAPAGQLVNPVGAGDSMVAGFLAGYDEGQGDYAFALKMGTCAGSASAFTESLASRQEVEMLLKNVYPQRITRS